MRKKTIIIGLDGMSKELVEELIRRNKIPNIKKIIKKGSLRQTKGVIPPNSVPSWPCIITGKNPGELGLFGYHKLRDYLKVPMFHNNYVPFWEKINCSSGVINIPGTYPARAFNGFILTGIYTPSVDDENFIYPKKIRDLIKEELKKYEIVYNWNGMEDLIVQVRDSTKIRFKVARKLLKEFKPDLFFVVETGTDGLQHLMAKYVYDDSPIYEKNERYEKAFYDYYALVDKEIGKLLKDFNGDVIILSDHGHGALHGKFHLNEWLLRNGFLKLKGRNTLFSSIFNVLNLDLSKIDMLLGKFKAKKLAYKLFKGTNISKIIPAEVGSLQWNDAVKSNLIDWKNSSAFAMDNGIYINTKRRFNSGSVNDEDFEEIRESILDKLKAEKNWGFKQVVKKKEEVYHGPFVDETSDLIFYDENFRFWPSASLKTKGLFTILGKNAERSGNHKLNGRFISNFCVKEKEVAVDFLYHFLEKKYGLKKKNEGKDESVNKIIEEINF